MMRQRLFSRFDVANPTLQAVGRLLAVTHQKNAQQALLDLGQKSIIKLSYLDFESPEAAGSYQTTGQATGAKKRVTFALDEEKGVDSRPFSREQEIVEAALQHIYLLFMSPKHNYEKDELRDLYTKLKGILDAYLEKMRATKAAVAKVKGVPDLYSPPSTTSEESSDTSVSERSDRVSQSDDSDDSPLSEVSPKESPQQPAAVQQPTYRSPSPVRTV